MGLTLHLLHRYTVSGTRAKSLVLFGPVPEWPRIIQFHPLFSPLKIGAKGAGLTVFESVDIIASDAFS